MDIHFNYGEDHKYHYTPRSYVIGFRMCKLSKILLII